MGNEEAHRADGRCRGGLNMHPVFIELFEWMGERKAAGKEDLRRHLVPTNNLLATLLRLDRLRDPWISCNFVIRYQNANDP